jgi:hypothetical protein
MVRAALAALLVLLGCTTTTFEYIDPIHPEIVSRFERTTFLRHGTAEVEFPSTARIKVVDKPMSPQLAWTTAALGCIIGAVVGAAGGPVTSIAGCLVGGVGGGMAGATATAPPEPAPVPESAPDLDAAYLTGRELVCSLRMPPYWCF